MEEGRWKMEDGRWKMEDGRWKMEDGRWKIEDRRQKTEDGTLGIIPILHRRSMTADNLLVITRDLQRSCFAPTNIFAKHRCTRTLGHTFGD
ncbi:MAG: AraC family transcriptional regulator [Oscillatoriales cyanobacterium]|nr:MAG: AraC family transcriptional regulator [Oscillatoriales cyanobacterium]TAD97320.1 MAG: AraC family transcriptional regulator [Oscillatoriales cyanobacterium]TAE07142.1 MAG: AraC family transcriptional regulator [Oscillatoriales cyanobacterium]TAF05743.1 MAG: AraC family transcriptional regulator [Oscillatoriales cyanobacterium]TAF43271.1 MAG: AraC family transcriptional regulator [Oscillatoriales cyanobacterium]